MTSSTRIQTQSRNMPVYLIVAAIGSIFLFYIDEGNYSLRGLTNPGNLIAMSFYVIGILIGQLVSEHFLFRNTYGIRKLFFVSITGFFSGIFIAIFIIYFIKYFFISAAYIADLIA